MLQGFINQLLNQAKTKAASSLPAAITRSVGAIDDSVVRPLSRFSQNILAKPLVGTAKTFRPGAKAEQLVREQTGRFVPNIMPPASPSASRYTQSGTERFLQEFGGILNPASTRTAASLRPGPNAAAFPLDNPLARLQATGQYLGRQGTNLLQTAQSWGPTALNPLATRTPTTRLGQVGSLLNPLNPRNFRDSLIGGTISAFVPEDNPNKGNLEIFAFTPGGLIPKIAATAILGATSAGPTDEEEAALIRRYSRENIRPFGGDASIKNEQGKVWAGQYYGFQSPESFNKLYGANLPTTPGGAPPPDPTLPPSLGAGSQAGQLTAPPAAPAAPGVASNGAGVPAQRQNVQQRALSQEVLNAAQQYSAPTGIPLSSFYAGQQQLGRSMEQGGELQRQLRDLGGAAGMADEAFMAWAKANPGLAYRELIKRQRGM